jgi:hypothetical protein
MDLRSEAIKRDDYLKPTIQKTYMKDKTAVIEVFKNFGQSDTLEQTIDKLVTLIDKARRHG